jgi:hypothetical protein
MKIRIQGNSIRFRLKQTEVKRFSEMGEITETTYFGVLPADKFLFVLKRGSSNDFKISFRTNTVTVEMPAAMCVKWTATDLVGVEEVITAGAESIKVQVEKDFQCMDGTEADNKDAYPNPNNVC